ncbi:peptide ABC transporter ATP-binding protein [Lachnospiraceae bacterium oral taxon 500]|nr:peptide ABC transporter ATP-binding protein [Lachnospiraceae bacterium oral taxon 500]
MKLLEIKNLVKHFPVKNYKDQVVHAVDDVSFHINEGETLGLVGESGCGKSTCARTIIRIYDPSSGQIIFDGQDIAGLSQKQLKPVRKNIQMIFQDPYTSLNGRMTVRDIIAEPLEAHQIGSSKAERNDMVNEILKQVGLNAEHSTRYAHEFSGGQRQRIGIARALILRPKLVICDEPISALDVSIQAQIINLLTDFQQKEKLTYLFIAHDLSVVEYISDYVGVMYLGKLVELSESKELYKNPLHPYTKGLLASIPSLDVRAAKLTSQAEMSGDIPSPISLPPGCRFYSRCPYAKKICQEMDPVMKEAAPGHQVACHLY